MEGEFHEALYDKNVNEKMLFTNNARKMAGVPMRRKKDKRKRILKKLLEIKEKKMLLNL